MAIVMKTKIQRKQKKKKMSNSERILFEKWSLFFPVLICKTFVCIKHPAPCCKQKAWEASSCFQQWEKGAKHFESWLVETEKKKKTLSRSKGWRCDGDKEKLLSGMERKQCVRKERRDLVDPECCRDSKRPALRWN